MSSNVSSVPPALRYARRHGLCYDHQQENILQNLIGDDLVDRSPDFLALPHLLLPKLNPPSDGKLRLSEKASRLLVSLATQPPKPDWRDLLSDHHKLRKLKIEPPLLMTDHGKDMRRFLPKRRIGVEDIDFPLEVVDEENDEGLSWPSHTRKLCSQWDDEIAHAKLQTSRETLKFLSRTLRDPWTKEDNRELVRELSKFEKKLRLEPLSPPLMPDDMADDSSLQPCVPSSPASLQPLTHNPATLTSIPKDSTPRETSYKNYISFDDAKISDVKLPEYHPISFKYGDDELVYDEADERTSSTVREEKTGSGNSDTVEPTPENDFFSARSLLTHLVVPQLNLHASGERYPIPHLPLPHTSVTLFEDEPFHRCPTTTKPLQLKSKGSHTKGLSFSEKLETPTLDVLHGIAIPADIDLFAESIEGSGYQLPLVKDAVKSHRMLWKPKMLSLLKIDHEDQDELVLDFLESKPETMPVTKLDFNYEEAPDASVLIKCELPETKEVAVQKEDPKAQLEKSSEFIAQAENMIIPEKRKVLEDVINQIKKTRTVSPISSTKFSATGSLSSFLSTRSNTMNISQDLNVNIANDAQADVLVPTTQEAETAVTDLSAPSILALDSLRTIFFSNSQVQQHRSILRFFESWAGAKLKIIYRDLEVPILLGPKHALMMTTLQALTQRPLPGQGGGANSAVHDHIARLSRESSFEVLVILVSTTSFCSNNHSTMSGFTAFCDVISRDSDFDIRPLYLLAGEAELHSMVAELTIKYAFHSSDLVFLQDETIWERFLVKAGMNPFAAQAVMGQLKDTGDGMRWGLGAFMQMSQQERKDRFGDTVGNKILERVRKLMNESTT